MSTKRPSLSEMEMGQVNVSKRRGVHEHSYSLVCAASALLIDQSKSKSLNEILFGRSNSPFRMIRIEHSQIGISLNSTELPGCSPNQEKYHASANAGSSTLDASRNAAICPSNFHVYSRSPSQLPGPSAASHPSVQRSAK